MTFFASIESFVESPVLAVVVVFPLLMVLLLTEAARIAPSQFQLGRGARAMRGLLLCAFAALVVVRFAVLSV